MLSFNRYLGDHRFRLLDNLEAMNYDVETDPKYLTVYGKINEYLDLIGGEQFYYLSPPVRVKLKIERSTFLYKMQDFYDKSIVFTTKEGFDLFLEQNRDKFKNCKQFEMIKKVKWRDKFCIYDKI
jgi:hypothetical protein